MSLWFRDLGRPSVLGVESLKEKVLLCLWLGVIKKKKPLVFNSQVDKMEQSISLRLESLGMSELPQNDEHPGLICLLKCHCAEKLPPHSQPGMPWTRDSPRVQDSPQAP